MCVVLRHKVIGNLLQQQKNTGTFRKKTMSYSASRTLGSFPWMLTGSILILKIFAWQSQQPHTEKHIQHTIHPTIAEFTDALARGNGNSYIPREGLDGLLDIFQCYNSIIIIKSKN